VKRVINTCVKCVVPHAENDFRPYLLRSAGIILVVLVIVGGALGATVYRLALERSSFLASVLPAVLVDLANEDRTKLALASLTVNPMLEEAAHLKAEHMAENGYFAHESPDGKTPWFWFAEAGYVFVYAGENLAINFDDSAAVNSAWMSSPGHRANILNGHYTEIGIATAKGQYEGRETTFAVQLFGSPARMSALATEIPLTIPTSTALVSARLEEQSVIPITVSTLEGAGGTEAFLAVKSATAIPAETVTDTAGAASYTALIDRFLSSPTMLLRAAYGFLALILVIAFAAVFWHPHLHQRRHALIILGLLVLIAILYALTSSSFASNLEIR